MNTADDVIAKHVTCEHEPAKHNIESYVAFAFLKYQMFRQVPTLDLTVKTVNVALRSTTNWRFAPRIR